MPPIGQDDAVDQQDAPHGQLHFAAVSSLQRFFQPGQRGAGAGDAAVAGLGVLLEGQAARKAAREAPGVEIVQEAAVIEAVDAQHAPRLRPRRSSRCRRGSARS